MNNGLRSTGIFLLFSMAAFVARVTMWIAEKFGSPTIESIIFHYQNALVGTPPTYITSFADLTLDSLALGLAVMLFYRFLSKQGSGRWVKGLFWLGGGMGLCWSLAFFSARLDVVPYLAGTYKVNTFIEEEYAVVNPAEVVFPEKKRNIIILSLESMETTFARTDLFDASLIPRLEAVRAGNPHCTLYEGKNLDWTIASLTGVLFGLPLSTPTQNQYKSSDNTFLPGATSLLEVLEKNGYSMNFMLSGKAEFSGAKNLFSNHAPSTQIRGWEYFESRDIPVRGDWGMRDKDLYGQVRQRLEGLAAEEQPFFMIIQTIDTHSYAVSYGDYPKPYRDDRDSFIAADYMALEFLDWLKEQDFYDNTTILVMGDHLYMRDRLGTVFLPDDRHIYNAFINVAQGKTVHESLAPNNSAQKDGGQKDGTPKYNTQGNGILKGDTQRSGAKGDDTQEGRAPENSVGDSGRGGRQATMLDMGVSLLDAAGVKIPGNAFGLGRSIFSDKPTLVERYGVEKLGEALSGQSTFYNSLFVSKQGNKRIPLQADE